MNRTSCFVVLVNQDAIEIKADATFALIQGGIQAFASLDDLQDAVAHINPYATYEPDFWLLDGNYKFAPGAADVGYMSTAMSAANTNFAPVPEIRITFTTNHSTNGLKLYFSEFSGDWADSVSIGFYNSVGGLIRSDTYAPTSAIFETNQAVSNFRRIDIFLNSTNKAQRYARLTGIDFDELTIFSGTDIKAARLMEEIDPIALELPINELELTLFSANGDFSIVDPAGFYANLQYKEPLDVYEQINGEVVYIGRFYLDEWEGISENEATFKASDAIGLLDTEVFYIPIQSYFTSGNDDAEEVLDMIMDGTDIPYEMDASLSSAGIDGWVPVVSRREALQQLAFRLGAYVTCARSDKVRILPMELASDLVAYDYTITATTKGLRSPITLMPLVTGVELLARDFFTVLENIEFFSGTLPVGTHLFRSDVPLAVIDRTDGTGTSTFFDYGANWVTLTVSVAGTFTLTISDYGKDATSVHRVENGSLPAGTPKNITYITDAMLVNRALGGSAAQRVYDYYQQRYLQKTKLFAHRIAVGDSVLIATQSSRQIAGIVERMETDLASGFVSDLEIVGIVVPL